LKSLGKFGHAEKVQIGCREVKTVVFANRFYDASEECSDASADARRHSDVIYAVLCAFAGV